MGDLDVLPFDGIEQYILKLTPSVILQLSLRGQNQLMLSMIYISSYERC